MKASGTFRPVSWDETVIKELPDQRKMTRVTAVYEFSGQVAGKGNAEYLMYHSRAEEGAPLAGRAEYQGYVIFQGAIDGQKGECVLKENGIFADGAAQSIWRIEPGSGAEGLAGVTGRGKYTASHQGSDCEIDYELG